MPQLEQLPFHSRQRMLTNGKRGLLLAIGTHGVVHSGKHNGRWHFRNVPCHVTLDTVGRQARLGVEALGKRPSPTAHLSSSLTISTSRLPSPSLHSIWTMPHPPCMRQYSFSLSSSLPSVSRLRLRNPKIRLNKATHSEIKSEITSATGNQSPA